MKKLILSAVILIMGISQAVAQKEDKLVIYAGQYTKLDIAEDMNIVLVQASSSDSVLKISKESAQKLRIGLSSSTLRIAPQHSSSKNTVVYIVFHDLKTLTIGQASKVRSEGELKIQKLDMYLEDYCLVNLNTNAKVKAYSLGQHEVVLKRSAIAAPVSKIF